jgi:hypothetical protein
MKEGMVIQVNDFWLQLKKYGELGGTNLAFL